MAAENQDYHHRGKSEVEGERSGNSISNNPFVRKIKLDADRRMGSDLTIQKKSSQITTNSLGEYSPTKKSLVKKKITFYPEMGYVSK